MSKKSNIDVHVHPFLGKNSIVDVVQAMDDTDLDIVALLSLDDSLYPYLVEESRKLYPSAAYDQCGIRLPNGKYILNAREYNTRENIHVLTVGHSMDNADKQTEIRRVIDNGLDNGAVVLLDHPFVDNAYTRTAGHISNELENELENLCKEYSGEITLEWNGYCIPWMRFILKNVLNVAGYNFKYHDVNKRVEKLSAKLSDEGYNVPVLADTDLHARNKQHLQYMGTAGFTTEVEGETAQDVLESMKRNIFEGKYANFKKYVSSFHLLKAFCFPIMLPGYFKKPRA